jgi:site-specific DNA-methyltransferase (cytosine-N4-specific)
MTINQPRYTTKQAAQAIGVSKETLLRWLYDGLVKEPPRDRRGWRVFTQPDIDRIAAWNSTIQPAPKRQPEPQGAR